MTAYFGRALVLVSISVCISLFAASTNNSGRQRACAPFQPVSIVSITNDKLLPCLLQLFNRSDMLVNGSKLTIDEVSAIPDSHGWSHCSGCGLDNGKIQVLKDVTVESNLHVDLSWSHWGEFFHHDKNDQLRARIRSPAQFQPLYVIDRPVYILPMLTVHVGHLLVDLLEQVHASMLRHYGRVRHDALLIVDVASADERAVLREKLWQCCNSPDSKGSIGYVVRSALTELPLYTVSLLHELSAAGQVLLLDLHAGLDLSTSYYQMGYRYHPCVFAPRASPDIDVQATRYLKFANHINATARRLSEVTATEAQASELIGRKPRVSFIQRAKDRVLLNMDAAMGVAADLGLHVSVHDLDTELFSAQLASFADTDILVSAAGTALHNVLFMRPGSAVVVLMQPGWCEWAWMYADQAVLLGIRPYVYCASDESLITAQQASDDTARDVHFAQWSRRFWRQGPRASKGANFTLDVPKFSQLIKLAAAHVATPSTDGHKSLTNDKWSMMCTCTGSSALTAVLTTKSKPRDAASASQTHSAVRVYVSRVSVESVVNAAGAPSLRMGVSGEIAVSAVLAASLPRLSVCLLVLQLGETGPAGAPWCFPLSAMDYYSQLFLDAHSGPPVYLLHFWAQATHAGGKFRGSDVFVAVDCRLPQAGLWFPTTGGATEQLQLHVFVQEGCGDGQRVRVTESARDDTNADNDQLSAQCHSLSATQQLVLELRAKYDFQRQATDFCLSRRLSPPNCLIVIAAATRRLMLTRLLVSSNLPSVQRLPTPAQPFVFLHIEKTGGTTLREFLIESADALGLQYFVPCHGDVHCVTLQLPPRPTVPSIVVAADGSEVTGTLRDSDEKAVMAFERLRNVSIVAGHFFWEVWQQLPAVADSSQPPMCAVVGRDPVERAISYYYQRCFQLESCVGHQRRINDLTVDELEFVARSERQAAYAADNRTVVVLDEGMSDAACRAMAGLRATTGLVYDPAVDIPLPEPLGASDRAAAIVNVRHCVVGLLERWDDTQRVLHRWLPWVDFSVGRTRRKMFLYRNKETASELRPELREVLLRLNACDVALYAEMQNIFERQLDAVNTVDGAFT